MPRGPEATAIDLTEGGRAELERRRGAGRVLAQRIRIVLACAAPEATNLGVARVLGVSWPTVATWRGRFAAYRLEELMDAPCPGVPRTIDDAAVERLIAVTLEEAPRNATHWSTRAMPRRAGMSQTAVSRIPRAFGLRPHRAQTFSRPTRSEALPPTIELHAAARHVPCKSALVSATGQLPGPLQ